MDSLANYDSEGENSNTSVDIKTLNEEKYTTTHHRSAVDVNYDPVRMDMSEDSNNNNSSGDSSSDGTRSPRVSHRSTATLKADSARTRTSPSDQRRSDQESNTSHCRGESKRTDKNDRSRNDEKYRRLSDSKDIKRSRDDERKTRDDDRRREKNSSTSRDERKDRDDRDRKDKDHHHHHHHHDRRPINLYSDRTQRNRDRDRRHCRIERTRERHREDRPSSHQKEKERVRSRSRSKERAPLPFRTMSYREEKGRNKLAQLEKLGIELKAPEGTTVTSIMLGEQNYYNPLTTASQGKYAEQIQKRKLLWANKSKQEVSKATTTVVESTTNTWMGTTFTHDQDGKLIEKFKRLMGIRGDIPAGQLPGQQKPDILKKQEEMFSNMEQQYEVARATTHTQRGVGLGYGSSGYQFPR